MPNRRKKQFAVFTLAKPYAKRVANGYGRNACKRYVRSFNGRFVANGRGFIGKRALRWHCAYIRRVGLARGRAVRLLLVVDGQNGAFQIAEISTVCVGGVYVAFLRRSVRIHVVGYACKRDVFGVLCVQTYRLENGLFGMYRLVRRNRFTRLARRAVYGGVSTLVRRVLGYRFMDETD